MPLTYENLAPDLLIDGILPPEPPNRPPGPPLNTKRLGFFNTACNKLGNSIVNVSSSEPRKRAQLCGIGWGQGLLGIRLCWGGRIW